MSRPDKKQRHKAKRQAKKREMRRRDSISPLKRLADAPGEAECWISDGFEEQGQRQLFCYKRAAGLTGVACFLVDNGMRLPKDWQKCASLINGVGDWASADVSEFEMEFAGHPDDLRQRLIKEPFRELHPKDGCRFCLL